MSSRKKHDKTPCARTVSLPLENVNIMAKG